MPIIDPITARIPELPTVTDFRPNLSLSDQLPVCLQPEDKTVWTNIQALRLLILGSSGGNGSGGTTTPVLVGNKLIYVVPQVEAGGTTASIPELAGKTFSIERGGFPLLPSEYNILNSGGFELTTAGDTLELNERFKLEVNELVAATPGTGGGSLLSGFVLVNTNKTLSATTDLNKVIQIRGGQAKITLTLPQLSTVPDHSIILIEATVNNDKQNRVTTQLGQLIYMNNTSFSSIYLSPGEVVWLLKEADGYYVINEFGKTYLEVGKPIAAYKVGLNELLCQGQEVLRADYPKLWEVVQGYGSSLVSDAVWLTPTIENPISGETVYEPYRGCFSTGDGSTTFRLPNLMNVALRGVESLSGTDNNRVYNKPGGYQASEVGEHDHKVYGQDNDASPIGGTSNEVANVGNPPPASGSTYFRTTSKHNVGGESVMANVGVLWVVKY